MTDAVTVRGLASFLITLQAADRQLADLTATNRKAAGIVASAGRAAAPRVSGHLAAGITARATARFGEVIDNRPYAAVIHWGWPARNIAPDEFLSSAGQAVEPVWLGLYANDIQNALNLVKGI